ncbi:Probable chitinase 10 [Sergentomyia squamirostris]
MNAVVCLFLLVGLLRVNGLHEPQPGTPTFLRSAVESPPAPDRSKLKEAYTEYLPFGFKFLPLRSAVESAPSVPLSSRTPLRDAVEARPVYEDEEPKRRWKRASFYDAFSVPNPYSLTEPQPYRIGSPYQQLVDPSELGQPFGQLTREPLRDPVPSALRRRGEPKRAEEQKVLCYFTNWAFYRKSDGQFVPELIDSQLCSYVIYTFATLDVEKLIMKEFDPWADLENDLFRRTTKLDVPVLLAIGGWTDSNGDKYSRLAASPSARSNFIKIAVTFLKQFNFSGLMFDWNYPKCWQSNCKKGPASDKANFATFMEEMSKEFRKQDPPLKLGVSLSGYSEVIKEAYDLKSLSQSADFMPVMTYDYHGAWEGKTGHVSPLYARPGDRFPQYNTDYTMQELVKMGAYREKLIMGVPFYGQTFTLKESPRGGVVGEGVDSRGTGNAGEFTRQPGMLAYYEICDRVRKQKWDSGRDSSEKAGPFAWRNNQWVGYEDPKSITVKTKYVKEQGFGGIMAWTVDLDDFMNRCCHEAFPLLKAINRGLGRLSNQAPVSGDCTRPAEPVTPPAPVMTTVGEGGVDSMHHHTGWPAWTSTASTAESPTTESTGSTPWWVPPPTTTEQVWWSPEPTSTSTVTTTTTTSTTTPRTTTRRPTEAPTTAATVIPPPANIMPQPHPDNRRCDGSEHIPNEKDCSSYYRCSQGEFILQHCAAGLHWNQRANVCDWPANAKCTQDVAVSTPEPPKRTTSSTTVRTTTPPKRTTTTTAFLITTRKPVSEASCTSGQYYPHKDCSKYYICVNENRVTQDCPPGLQYSYQATSCDWPDKVKCMSVKDYYKKLGYKAVQEGDSCEEGTYAPYPNDCTQYLRCIHNRFDVMTCADGLHWNDGLKNCDWPKRSGCKQGKPPKQPDNREPQEESKPPHKDEEPPPQPLDGENVAESSDLKPMSGYYKMVCYFTNWAWYRRGLGKYVPEDIDTNLCTHVVYGFAVLDYSELILRTHDSWADIDNKFYERVSGLKLKGVKVSLALGGWNDSQGDKYSRLVRSTASRKKFIEHALLFIDKYGFEGLDLDWEYPVCWQVDCKKGYPDEKQGFADLVRELSEAFKPKGYLLSTAVSPSKMVIDAGYDVPTLAKYFDWIAVMTYDFHGQWDKQTGHVAPLYYHPEDEVAHFNANFSLNYWIEKGAPARKIIMGMPLYGQSFTLADPKNRGLNAKAPGPGQAGEFTKAAGFLAYYEICDKIRNQGWTVVKDEQGRMGPYAYRGNQWVSYDDQDILKKKAQLVRSMNLGGGMVWALDLDDFKNRCGQGKHPLLKVIREALRDPPSGYEPAPVPTTTPKMEEPQTPADNPIEEGPQHKPAESAKPEGPAHYAEPSVDFDDADNSAELSNEVQGDFKVVCYFTNWAWYRQGGGKFVPEDIDPELCTHIVYGFAVLNRDTLTIQPHDSWADTDNKFYERVVAFKKKGLKVTVAIGGWNDSAGDKYSRLVLSPTARSRFVKHVREFIEKYGFDGLDLDWEYPVCWQVDCNKGSSNEKEGFVELVRELSQEFRPRGLLLSSAVSPSKKVIDEGYEVAALSQLFDWIAVMTYDFHGQWDKQTGHVAPMYQHPTDFEPTFNANYSINYWIQKGADPKKIVMGMPMYGQSFSLAETNRHGLNSPTYGGGEAGEATRARGFLAYYEICSNIKTRNWQVVRDKKGRMGPYAYNRDQWVSFDDIAMIRHKSEYVKAMGLGGAMIWALDLDDFRNVCGCEEYPLLRTINRVLRKYPTRDPKCSLEIQTEYEDDNKQPTPVTTTTTERVTTRKTTQTPPKRTTTLEPLEPESNIEESLEEGLENQDCSGDSMRAHENDCNKYYICQFGHYSIQRCPQGLHWNRDHCDWPDAAKCGTAETTTKRPKPPKKTTKKPLTTTEVAHDAVTEKPVTRPEPEPLPPPTQVSGDPKVVCYFTNWAWYRPGEGKYTPDDIDASLCTHIVYGFAVLNRDTLTIKTHDSWADIDNRFYERVVEYKKKGIKVTLAIGGWNDSLGDKYSRLVRSPEARARFVKTVSEFIEKYGFDGLDLDWEYPVCWQVECDKGYPDEKEGFANLVKELAQEFRPRGWILSSAVSPSKMVIDAGYDVPTLADYFDWIAVMTYDFHGHWDKQTGHVAPLYYYPGDTYDYFNANFSINYWMQKGAPASKLVMGIPLYGQSFSLADTSKRGMNEKSYGPGEAGEFTRAGGFLAFYEICQRANTGGWTVVRDSQGRIGPYAYKGAQWVSYDDVSDVRRKAQFIREMKLGGGMIWALDLDDFRGRCGCGKHPLLRTLNQELRGIGGQRATDCT